MATERTETAPNQGATGDAPGAVREAAGGPPPPSEPPVNVGAPVNQGATAAGPAATGAGESPLSVGGQQDQFAERPEVYVGAAFAGGFVLAKLLRRWGPS
jgi:hypothetical protein